MRQGSHRRESKPAFAGKFAHQFSLRRDPRSCFATDAHGRSVNTNEWCLIVVAESVENIHCADSLGGRLTAIGNESADPDGQWFARSHFAACKIVARAGRQNREYCI